VVILRRRSDGYYRLTVRSSRTRRRLVRQAVLRATLLIGAAVFVATLLWSMNVLGRTLG